jgi:hypothetical protein
MKIAFDERVKENADLLFHPEDQGNIKTYLIMIWDLAK